jgi:HK97 family phage major capsid protein
MKLTDLIEERNKTWNDMRTFLDSKQKDGVLSDDDNQTYNAMESKLDGLNKSIEREQKLAQFENALKAPINAPILGTPGKSEKITTSSNEYKEAFWNSLRNKNFRDIRNDLEVGEKSEGGYLVPDEFERTLIEALTEENIMRSLATTIKTESGDRKIPIVKSKGQAYWLDEEEAYKLSDDEFGQTTLNAYKVGTAIKISEELLNDSAFDLEAYISKEFARRVGAKEEEAFFVGDGNGKPTGIFDTTNGGELGATTSGASITFDDIIELFYSVNTPYRKKGVWLLNDSSVKLLRKIKDSTGNYIWSPAVSADLPDTILNRPYYTSAYAPTAESGSRCIAFGDMSYYWIADREGRTFQRLNELYAMTGQVGFRGYERVDGKLILPEAVKTLAIK